MPVRWQKGETFCRRVCALPYPTPTPLLIVPRQIVITIGFLIALMIVIGINTPVDLGTFNPAGWAPNPPPPTSPPFPVPARGRREVLLQSGALLRTALLTDVCHRLQKDVGCMT